MKDNNIDKIRELLGSISYIKEDNKLTEKELIARAGSATTFYETTFKNVLQELINAQIEFIAKEANNMEQVSFGRGTLNGFILLDEWFRTQKGMLITDEE